MTLKKGMTIKIGDQIIHATPIEVDTDLFTAISCTEVDTSDTSPEAITRDLMASKKLQNPDKPKKSDRPGK